MTKRNVRRLQPNSKNQLQNNIKTANKLQPRRLAQLKPAKEIIQADPVEPIELGLERT